MTARDGPTPLERRLGRLRGTGGSECLPTYRGRAGRLKRSPRFPIALARFRALADPNRLLAVSLLRRSGELCACEIQAATGLTHATVSHHMALLVAAGLVRARRRGTWVYYRIAAGLRIDELP